MELHKLLCKCWNWAVQHVMMLQNDTVLTAATSNIQAIWENLTSDGRRMQINTLLIILMLCYYLCRKIEASAPQTVSECCSVMFSWQHCVSVGYLWMPVSPHSLNTCSLGWLESPKLLLCACIEDPSRVCFCLRTTCAPNVLWHFEAEVCRRLKDGWNLPPEQYS